MKTEEAMGETGEVLALIALDKCVCVCVIFIS